MNSGRFRVSRGLFFQSTLLSEMNTLCTFWMMGQNRTQLILLILHFSGICDAVLNPKGACERKGKKKHALGEGCVQKYVYQGNKAYKMNILGNLRIKMNCLWGGGRFTCRNDMDFRWNGLSREYVKNRGKKPISSLHS